MKLWSALWLPYWNSLWDSLKIEMKFQGNDIVLEHGSVLIYTYPNIGDKIGVVVQWYAQFFYQDNESLLP